MFSASVSIWIIVPFHISNVSGRFSSPAICTGTNDPDVICSLSSLSECFIRAEMTLEIWLSCAFSGCLSRATIDSGCPIKALVPAAQQINVLAPISLACGHRPIQDFVWVLTMLTPGQSSSANLFLWLISALVKPSTSAFVPPLHLHCYFS